MASNWLCTWGNRHEYGETCTCEDKANVAFEEWKEQQRVARLGWSETIYCSECRRAFGGLGVTHEQRDSDMLYHQCLVKQGGKEERQ